MKHALPVFALLLVAPALVQAQEIAPEVDAAFARYAALPSVLVPILAEAQDKASADAAAPRLFAALPDVYEARSGLQGVGELDPQQLQLVQQKYESALRRDWGRLFEQIFRLQRNKCHGSLAFFKQFQTLCMMLEK